MQQSTPAPIDRWGIIKNWLGDKQRTIVLIVGIVLVVLISFGLGRLTTVPKSQKPVIIEVPQAEKQTANVGAAINSEEQNQNQGSVEQGSSDIQTTQNQLQTQTQSQNEKGIIVASKNGTKYHWPWCSYAKKIKAENQIWFKSEAEAQKAGYTACSSFQKLAPAGYKP